MTGWRPSQAMLRAASVGLVLLAVGLLAGRIELVVLAGPLALLAVLGAVHRPGREPRVATWLTRNEIREGEQMTLRTTVEGDLLEVVVRTVDPAPHFARRPESGLAATAQQGHRAQLAFGLRALRWGRYDVGRGQVAAHSSWGGFRWGPVQAATGRTTVLPEVVPFDAAADAPDPVGLVGAHRSRQPGEGTEFAGVREFAPGDRLRRIHWRTSLRTGELHVVATTAEQDTAVVLVIDAVTSVGASEGLTGDSSSLDVAVRAAAAVAEHHLRDGDRVGLRVLGGSGQVLAPRAGPQQRHRILHTLAQVRPAQSAEEPTAPAMRHWGLPAGTVVVAFSPLLSPAVATALVTLARRGLQVVAVDTLPESWRRTAGGGGSTSVVLARRIRLLERATELHQLAGTGIPVVGWRGPGTLDEVLRGLRRRARAPRVRSQ